MYGTVQETSHGQSFMSWARNVLVCALHVCYEMLQRLLLPQGRFHPPPLFAWAKAHPRAARNGPLRRESAAETTSWVPGPRNAFLKKLFICAEWRRRLT